jgi:hypothetical protein
MQKFSTLPLKYLSLSDPSISKSNFAFSRKKGKGGVREKEKEREERKKQGKKGEGKEGREKRYLPYLS